MFVFKLLAYLRLAGYIFSILFAIFFVAVFLIPHPNADKENKVINSVSTSKK